MTIDEQLRAAAHTHNTEFAHAVIPDLPQRRARHRGIAFSFVGVVAIVSVVIVAVASFGPSSSKVHITPATTPPSTPRPYGLHDGLLETRELYAPAFVPANEKLWSADSSDHFGTSFLRQQLFGTENGDGTVTGILVEFQPNSSGGSVGSVNATVRGHPAMMGPPKDAAGANSAVSWVEGDAMITATIRGMSNSQAIAVLDALHPRTPLVDGFDPASAPSDFPLLAETAPSTGSETTLNYAATDDTRNADLQLVIDSKSAYPGYLHTWIGGARRPDGTTVEPDAYSDYHLVTVTWPDGRAVRVESTSISDEPTLERVARSVHRLSAAESRALVESIDRSVASLPALGSAALPTGTIQVRGNGSNRALCLSTTNGQACASNVTMFAPTDASIGSFISGKAWVILAAAPAGAPTVNDRLSASGVPLIPALPAETATIDGWHVALVHAPSHVGFVFVDVPLNANGGARMTRTRPS